MSGDRYRGKRRAPSPLWPLWNKVLDLTLLSPLGILLVTDRTHPVALKVLLGIAVAMAVAGSVSKRFMRWLTTPIGLPKAPTSDSSESNNH